MPHVPHTKRLEEGGGMQHFREALAAVLEERVEFPRGSLVTVMDAKVTRDTLHAKGVLSVLPVTREKEVREALKEYEHEIKDGLAKHLRMRRIPKLHWEFDYTEAKAGEIDADLLTLKKRGEL